MDVLFNYNLNKYSFSDSHNQDIIQGIKDKPIRKMRIKYTYRGYILVGDIK